MTLVDAPRSWSAARRTCCGRTRRGWSARPFLPGRGDRRRGRRRAVGRARRACWRCPTPRWSDPRRTSSTSLRRTATTTSSALLDERFALVAPHVERRGRPVARAAPAHRRLHEPGVRDRVGRPVQPVDGRAPRPERAAAGAQPVRHERPRRRRGARLQRRAAHRRLDAADVVTFDAPGPTTSVRPVRHEIEHSRDDLLRQNASSAGTGDDGRCPAPRALPAVVPGGCAVEGSAPARRGWRVLLRTTPTFPPGSASTPASLLPGQPGRAQRDRGPPAGRGGARRGPARATWAPTRRSTASPSPRTCSPPTTSARSGCAG